MKKYIPIMAAFAALVNLAGAAVITFPDLSSGGTFTLNAGDVTTNTATANIADQATAALNINGDWHHGGYEVQLGGVNYDATQDVTLNIGSSGSVTWGNAWMGDGVPYGGTVVIDIAAGGKLINDGSGFGTRPHASDGNWSASWSDLWDAGMLKRDGLGKADLASGADSFLNNFTLTGSIGSAHTLTAIAPSTNTFVHPGIGLTIDGLNSIKANLDVEPWKTGYEDLLSASQSSLDYTPYQDGTLVEVGRLVNNSAWESDMKAVHNMARLWYFTGDEAYAQKGRDILISWATTQTNWLETPNTYLVQGYHAWQVFEGADILRGTWPGWTDEDTATCKAYFEDVCWKGSMTSVPNPLKSANQGMSQFAPALGIAIFNDDQEKFEQCLQAFRADAVAALGNTLPNGQVGDTGRDAHDQGQLMLMAWAAEVFWNQGVDVYSEYDNRLLAAAEYISRYNLLVDTSFVQAGTVYDVYPSIHSLEGEYANYGIETKMISTLYTAYVTRQGMRSPYLEKYITCPTQNADSFCYLLPSDSSTATVADPIVEPAEVASVTSLNQVNLGDCTTGSATYSADNKTWTVTGRGSSFTDSSADLRFAYLPVTGDATIIAKLTSISGTDNNARAGVLITETLSENSKMQAMVVSNPSGDNEMNSYWVDAEASSHNPTGGSGTRSYNSQPDPKVPYWLKIERIGNRIHSYSSPDGASWACGEGAEYDMGETVYIGLAVSSDSYSSTATATFTDVRITGGDGGEASEIPAAPYHIMASPGGDVIPLRWLESFEADSYKIWRTTTPGGPYTLLTEETGTSFIDTNVVFGTHYYYAVSAVNAIGESGLSTESTFEYADTDFYEGEDYDAQSGVNTESTADYFGGLNLSYLGDGDWSRYDNITIGTGAVFQARCATYSDPVGYIEVRLGSNSGTLVGVINPIDTDGAQYWATTSTNLSAAAVGTHDICLVYKGQTSTNGPGINLNWFDITYPAITEYDLGMDQTLSYDPATDSLSNLGAITAWDSTSSHLKLADGSDLSNLDFAALGLESWKTENFADAAQVTMWDGANLSGITLYTDGRFGAGDSFSGADFSRVVWGTPVSGADVATFFSGGSGATSAANAADAITFAGADLSLITGDARTVMINNLGGFDGATPIGAKFDPDFITNSGWNKAALVAAGWQYAAIEPFATIEGETYDDQYGLSTQDCSEGGLNVQAIQNGDWAAYYDIDFGNGADGFQARVASATSGGNIEIRLDSETGTLVGTCPVSNTGGWQAWETVTTIIGDVSGTHDVYLVFTGGSGYLCNLNWFIFTDSTAPAAPAGLTAAAGDGAVSLDWADNSESDLDRYSIYRSTSSGSGYVAIKTDLYSSEYTDASVVNGTTYYYVVSAMDVNGNVSADSSEVSASPAAEVEPAEFLVENIAVSDGNFTVLFAGTVGGNYRVETTDDLTTTNGWMVVTNVASLPVSPFEISTPVTNDAGFYRVISNP
jgi:fibronectin type 3 domain-containing protein